MDMIGMIPHYFVCKDFVYKDFTAPKLHDTCKRVAYDLWTGMKVTVTYESETRWDKTRRASHGSEKVAHLTRRQIPTNNEFAHLIWAKSNQRFVCKCAKCAQQIRSQEMTGIQQSMI